MRRLVLGAVALAMIGAVGGYAAASTGETRGNAALLSVKVSSASQARPAGFTMGQFAKAVQREIPDVAAATPAQIQAAVAKAAAGFPDNVRLKIKCTTTFTYPPPTWVIHCEWSW